MTNMKQITPCLGINQQPNNNVHIKLKTVRKMASLKFSSSIEHVCLQNEIFPPHDTGVLQSLNIYRHYSMAVLLIPSLHHHPKCICLNLFHLLCPALCSFLTCSLSPPISISLHSSSYFSPFLHPLCPGIIPAVSLRDLCPYRHNEYHKALSLPWAYAPERAASRTDPHTHDHGYDLRFQQ